MRRYEGPPLGIAVDVEELVDQLWALDVVLAMTLEFCSRARRRLRALAIFIQLFLFCGGVFWNNGCWRFCEEAQLKTVFQPVLPGTDRASSLAPWDFLTFSELCIQYGRIGEGRPMTER